MRRINIPLLVFCMCLTLAAWPQGRSPWVGRKIITFDVPGAGTGVGTKVLCLTRSARRGAVAGFLIRHFDVAVVQASAL